MWRGNDRGEEQVFAALADPTRRQLLSHLARNSPKTITQLTREFSITRQGITKHLNVLADAGLVHSWMQGRERLYALAPEPLENVTEWIDRIGQQWEARLSALRSLVENDNF